MKKLMIAAAIVCAAAFAQAASVSWSVTQAKGGNGNTIVAADAYTFGIAIYDAANDQLIGSSSDTSVGFGGSYSGSVDGTAGNHGYYAMLTAANADYTLADGIANTKFYFTTDGAETYSINFTTGNGMTTSGIGSWSASSWQAVPEPTSGLLLLLGVAGLALRRRRA